MMGNIYQSSFSYALEKSYFLEFKSA